MSNNKQKLKVNRFLIILLGFILLFVSVLDAADLIQDKPPQLPTSNTAEIISQEACKVIKHDGVQAEDFNTKCSVTNGVMTTCLDPKGIMTTLSSKLDMNVYEGEGKDQKIVSPTIESSLGFVNEMCYTTTTGKVQFGDASTIFTNISQHIVRHNYSFGSTNITLHCDIGDNDIFVNTIDENGTYKFGAENLTAGRKLCWYEIKATTKLIRTHKVLNTTVEWYDYYTYDKDSELFNEERNWYEFDQVANLSYNNFTSIKINDNFYNNTFYWDETEIDPRITGVSSCQTLDQANTAYVMSSHIAVSGTTCMVWDAHNVTLDMHGYNITNDGTGFLIAGALIDGFHNATVINGALEGYTTASAGISSDDCEGLHVQNVTFHNNAVGIAGFDMHDTIIEDNLFTEVTGGGSGSIAFENGGSDVINILVQNNIIIDGDIGIGFSHSEPHSNVTIYNNTFQHLTNFGIIINGGYLNRSNVSNNKFLDIQDITALTALSLRIMNSTFSNNIINNSGADCLSLVQSADNNFYNNNISNCLQESIIISSGHNNTFVNTTFTNISHSISAQSDFKWYYRAFVNDTLNNPVKGVNLSFFNSTTKEFNFNITTDSTGYTPKIIVTDFRIDGTTFIYYNNYTINANKSSHLGATRQRNFSLSNNIVDDYFELQGQGYPNVTYIYPINPAQDTVNHSLHELINHTVEVCAIGSNLGPFNVSFDPISEEPEAELPYRKLSSGKYISDKAELEMLSTGDTTVDENGTVTSYINLTFKEQKSFKTPFNFTFERNTTPIRYEVYSKHLGEWQLMEMDKLNSLSTVLVTPQVFEIKVVGYNITETVKWTVSHAEGLIIDPFWYSDVTIATNTYISGADFRTAQPNVFFINNTHGWAFYEIPQDPAYKNTSDGGLTWGKTVSMHPTSFTKLSLWYDKWTPTLTTDTLSIVGFTPGGDSDTIYFEFNTTNGSIKSSSIILDTGFGSSDGPPFVTKNTLGEIFLSTTSDSDRKIYKSTDAVTWSDITPNIRLTEPTDFSSLHPLPNGDILLTHHEYSGSNPENISWMIYDIDHGDGGNGEWIKNFTLLSFNTSTPTVTGFQRDSGFMGHGFFSVTKPTTGDVYIALVNMSYTYSGKCYIKTSKFHASNLSWTEKASILVTTISTDRCNDVGITYIPNEDKFYMVFNNATSLGDYKLYIANSTDDMESWQVNHDVLNSVIDDHKLLSITGPSNDKVFVTWQNQDSPTQLFGAIIDNETYPSPSKSGLISNITGTEPFYINMTEDTRASNPVIVPGLLEGECINITRWVNATGDTNINHTFFVYANITSDKSRNSQTKEVNITITTAPPDTYPPTFDQIPKNDTLEYFATHLGLKINATESNNPPAYFKINDTLRFNITNDGNITNKTLVPYGIYYINVTVNDTEDNYQSLHLRLNYTIVGGRLYTCPVNLPYADTYYSLQQDMNSTGTCITVEAERITIQGDENTITYGTNAAGVGIYSLGYNNIDIRNITILQGSAQTDGFGIRITQGNNVTIYNNSIHTLGSRARGITVDNSKWANITNNNVTVHGSGGGIASGAIYTYIMNHSSISQNYVKTTNTFMPGLNLDQQTHNNTISFNYLYTEGGSFSNPLQLQDQPENNTITNNTMFSTGASAAILSYNSARFNLFSYNNVTSLVHFAVHFSTGNGQESVFLNNNLTGVYAILDDRGLYNTLVYNNSFGEIKWYTNNMDSLTNLTFPGNIYINNNTAIFNVTSNLDTINDTSNITFYNMNGWNFEKPYIFKDNKLCGNECYNFTPLWLDTVIFNVTAWGSGGVNYSIQNSFAPYFNQTPKNSTVSLERSIDAFQKKINGTDVEGFDRFFINDTTRFNISHSGNLTNSTLLEAGIYYINVSINDTHNNVNSTYLQVRVQDENITACRELTALSSTYYLMNNINQVTGDCLVISNDYITLQMNEYLIRGVNGNTDGGVYSEEETYMTIFNGTITNFFYAVHFNGPVLYAKVKNMYLVNNSQGIQSGTNSSYTHNFIRNSSNAGMEFGFATSYNYVAHNNISESKDNACGGTVCWAILMDGERHTIYNNTMYENKYGIDIRNNHQIIYENIIYDDTEAGIITQGSSNNITLLNNNISGSGFDRIDDQGTGFYYITYSNNLGEIEWYTDNHDVTNDILFPSSQFFIYNNSAYFDPVTLGGLAVENNITLVLGETNFANPIILHNGTECTDCFNFTSLNISTVIFNTTGAAGNYSIGEKPITAPTWNDLRDDITSVQYGDQIGFAINISDETEVGWAIFAYNATQAGEWYNFTPIKLTGTTFNVTNFTTTVSNYNGTHNGYRFFFNDSDNAFNASDINTFTVNGTIGLDACGVLDIENEVYTLYENITQSNSVTCFNVQANNITINFNHTKNTGAGLVTNNWAVSSNGYHNLTVVNGTITNWGGGFYGGGIKLVNSHDNLISRMNVSWNFIGIQTDTSVLRTNISYSEFRGGGGYQTTFDHFEYGYIEHSIIDYLYFVSGSNHVKVYNTTALTQANIAGADYITVESSTIFKKGTGTALTISGDHNIINRTTFGTITAEAGKGIQIQDPAYNNTIINCNFTMTAGVIDDGTNGINNLYFENNWGEIYYQLDFDIAVHTLYFPKHNGNITIGNNSAWINGTVNAITALNTSFNVTLYGIQSWGFVTPQIAKDGAICNQCVNYTPMWADTVIFNTTGSGNFTIIDIDITPPEFTQTPQNLTLEFFIEPLDYDINATDNVEIDTWFVNDTRFNITTDGIIYNQTTLPVGIWFVNVSVNDTSNNINSAPLKYTVTDTTPPYWNKIPNNLTVTYDTEQIRVDYNATDYSNVDTYYFNHTNTNFNISPNGTITSPNAAAGDYYFTIYVNDTYNNINYTNYKIIINRKAPTSASLTVTPSTTETYPSRTVAQGSDSNPELLFNLYRNLTYIPSSTDTITLEVGHYLYNFTNVSGSQNYTGYELTETLIININNSACSILLNDTSGKEGPIHLLVGTNCQSEYELQQNGTIFDNNTLFILTSGHYLFNVSRNDTYNYSNVYDEELYIVTLDIGGPTFTTIPQNDTLIYGTNLTKHINATDDVEFYNFFINDTGRFNISYDGRFTNATILPVGIYYVNITANDTLGQVTSVHYQLVIYVPPFIANIEDRGMEWVKIIWVSGGTAQIEYSENNFSWESVSIINRTAKTAEQYTLKKDTLYYYRSKNETTDWYYFGDYTEGSEEADDYYLYIITFIVFCILVFLGYQYKEQFYHVFGGLLMTATALTIFNTSFINLSNVFLKNGIAILVAGIGFYYVLVPFIKIFEEWRG